ncbi:MAG: ECF-type sigma factor [Phycisphaerales bacterium]
MHSNPGETRQLLADAAAGDELASRRLAPVVYEQLRGLARAYLRRGSARDSVLQTTALVHDAFVRLLGRDDIVWESRAHFFAVAARAMGQILASDARRLRALRRGGPGIAGSEAGGSHGAPRVRLSLDALDPAAPASADDASGSIDPVALDSALRLLGTLDERQLRIVEMRFLAGMTEDEIASVLRVSRSTVEREWRAARAWLSAELRRSRT